MISGNEIGGLPTGRLQGVSPAGKRAVASGPEAGADAVALSGSAMVGRLVGALRSLPDVRPERVASVLARMDAGQEVSPAALAHRMLKGTAGEPSGTGG